MYIANQESLEAFVERARSSSLLAIDTEFLREKTYYAKLCLLQMATDSEVAVIDPFAVRDLRVIAPLLADESVLKLFHAGGQDLEILYREIGVLPHPVFDTQIAAALIGHTQQIGYGALVSATCGVSLKKIDSFTDWSRRPLSDSQLRYAADDVVYLPQVHRVLTEALEKKGRLGWLERDFDDLVDPARYESDPRERFRRLKRGNQLSRKQLAAAREVAAWREVEARRRDVPRKWVLTDEQIVEVCKREAATIDDLFMVRGVRERLTTRDARTVADLMRKSYALPEDEWPEVDRSSRNEPNVDAELDLMNAVVRLRARENGVAMQTLASHADLCQVARGHTDVDVLHGWRRAIVGEELLDLLAGRISLSLEGGGVKVTRVGQP
ncbi:MULTISPECIES: ribonuclease D [unclassified Adlercreutzia]|uniref:ribonuclease D n=1 Tax=unclassified Adlercreutzia TaxID=2636013 RepID=UPI0013EB5C82|nr:MULTISPECIES: ribonuclease D [unclassified Adlercreutzia]